MHQRICHSRSQFAFDRSRTRETHSRHDGRGVAWREDGPQSQHRAELRRERDADEEGHDQRGPHHEVDVERRERRHGRNQQLAHDEHQHRADCIIVGIWIEWSSIEAIGIVWRLDQVEIRVR